MKRLKHPTNKEQHAYMRMRVEQNVQQSKNSRAETWMAGLLKKFGRKWERQVQWGNRIFDFWCNELGCAIEVDGPEHNPAVDAYRDAYNRHRSAIIVFRVKNFDEAGARAVLAQVRKLEKWKVRRRRRPPAPTLRKQWEEATSLRDLVSWDDTAPWVASGGKS